MLNLAVASIFLSQVFIVYVPEIAVIFHVTALGLRDWAVIFAASVQPLLWMEAVKWFRARREGGGGGYTIIVI